MNSRVLKRLEFIQRLVRQVCSMRVASVFRNVVYTLTMAIFLMPISTLVEAKPAFGTRTLVIYDQKLTELDNYSTFLNNLKQRSHELSYRAIGNDSTPISLFRGEDKLYDNLIVYPIRSRHFNKQLSVENLLSFFSKGGQVLTITSPEGLSDNVRLFLNQLGMFPSPRNYYLNDYYHGDENNTLHLTKGESLNEHVVPLGEYDLVYKGAAALLDNRQLIIPVLQAPKTSFSVDSKQSDEIWTAGSEGYLAAAFQSLRNTRLAWVGSEVFFSNEFSANNGRFVEQLTKWAFAEKAVIKSVGSSHQHIGGAGYLESPYKVKDSVVYDIGLSEWDGSSWSPFTADDIQFELKMIDPYYRITLLPSETSNEAQYYTTGNFSLPDHHGIFTFLVDYKRAGLSFITEKDVRAIRHLANDEYLRSWDITNSWVYLTSIYSVITVWVLFVGLYLSLRKPKTVETEKKNN
ncbi:LAQU0S04e04434g1_1 [Lachancea quebecensis]|uniref:Dolichyl-diphosphooligosaccharide--protein glycosyltransferase subunit WBP1 n=1 Tax=Lachancea quebecensis TaxID=1654605 RepID=A0A0P1KQR1_9SACH|nr:LAQU0S04e04434g1_1 [Lachancea quebecensis]